MFLICREIKLENILLDEDGHCKLADFGVAELAVFHGMTISTVHGTECNCAPDESITFYCQYDSFIFC
jgi:serine/threonine protein kinase